jgi:uncharacterized protein YgiM (DUF1202 family)
MRVTGGPVAADGYTWYQIETWMAGPVAGWAAGEYLTHDADDGTNLFQIGDTVEVDTPNLNGRSGPGLGYAVDQILPGATQAVVLDGPVHADGYQWYQLQLPSGGIVWTIGEGLAASSGGGNDGGGSALFQAGDTVAVDAPRLNGRTGPGLGYGVDQVLLGGAQAVVLNGPVWADGYQWYQLQLTSGDVVWAIGEGLIASDGGEDPGFAVGDTATVATDGLNLRSAASRAAPIIRVLPEGAAVTVTGSPLWAEGYTWYPVRTGTGTIGWVAGEYLV